MGRAGSDRSLQDGKVLGGKLYARERLPILGRWGGDINETAYKLVQLRMLCGRQVATRLADGTIGRDEHNLLRLKSPEPAPSRGGTPSG